MPVQKNVKPTKRKTPISRLDCVLEALITESLSGSPPETTSGSPYVITTYPHHDSVTMEDCSTVVGGESGPYSPSDEDPNMSQDNGVPVVEDDENDSTYGEGPLDTTKQLCKAAVRCKKLYGRRVQTFYQDGTYPFPNDRREQVRQNAFRRHITKYFAGGNSNGYSDGDSGGYTGYTDYSGYSDGDPDGCTDCSDGYSDGYSDSSEYSDGNNGGHSDGGHGLFFAPIELEGKRVLDIGTGTGIWARKVGKLYPGADVTGIDLSPIQLKNKPVNVQWVIDDLELDWLDDTLYDFMYCGYMGGSIKDWPRLIGQMYQCVKPGGWVEFHELSTDITSDDGMGRKPSKLIEVWKDASFKAGRILDPTPYMKDWIGEAGFTNVQQRDFWLPIGNWPDNPRNKEIGIGVKDYMSNGLQGTTAGLVRGVLGWSKEEAEVLNAEGRGFMNANARLRIRYVVICAQKSG